MDSQKLAQICGSLSRWYLYNKESINSAPEEKGVYVFRIAGGRYFGRLRGESDILYIGSTEEKRKGLKGRLKRYINPNPNPSSPTIRINDMSRKYEMEIAWCPDDEAGNLETRLLRQYLDNHDELPPLNRLSKKLLKKGFIERVSGITKFKVEKLSNH